MPSRSPSRASVFAEGSRAFEQRLMNNARRSDYVEALVALALRDGGWTRKAPWDAWDFDLESGVRLKVKQSTAVQAWGNGETRTAPPFGIAPAKMYWDEKEGRCVPEPGRHADIYVFAWHGAPRETADQGDPTSWEFYAVPECDLHEQKSIALKARQGLTAPRRAEDLAVTLGGIPGRFRG